MTRQNDVGNFNPKIILISPSKPVAATACPDISRLGGRVERQSLQVGKPLVAYH